MRDPNIPLPKLEEPPIDPKEKLQQGLIDQLNSLEEKLKLVLEEPSDPVTQGKAKWELHDAINAVWDKMNRKTQKHYNGLR